MSALKGHIFDGIAVVLAQAGDARRQGRILRQRPKFRAAQDAFTHCSRSVLQLLLDYGTTGPASSDRSPLFCADAGAGRHRASALPRIENRHRKAVFDVMDHCFSIKMIRLVNSGNRLPRGLPLGWSISPAGPWVSNLFFQP